MILHILLFIAGLLLLIKGADWLVNGASALAKKYNVSDLAIGLTIVAFGTSAPELVVNTIASVQGHQDIVYGNIIGSNNFNLFVILGIAGLITPLAVQSNTVWKEIPLSLFAALLLFFLANDFLTPGIYSLSRWEGILLMLFFFGFLYYVYSQLKNEKTEVAGEPIKYSTTKITLLILAGLAGLVLGGRFVVNSAIEIATVLGVSQKIIGLTIVAAGTSLPELATSVVAALRRNNDIAVGNVIGSNIFNIFFILAISSIISPIPYDINFNRDLYFLLGGTMLLFLFMFIGKKKRLERWEAAILFSLYIVYTIYLLNGA